MTSEKSSFELRLEKLKAEYKTQLPNKIEAISADWQALGKQWLPEVMVALHRNTHSLIGTSGTFGFIDISKTARGLESVLKPLLDQKDKQFKPDVDLNNSVAGIINTLSCLISADAHHKKISKSISTNTKQAQLDTAASDFSDLDKQLTKTRNSGITS